jgi:hypothetical protein
MTALSMRPYYSSYHLWAARDFARLTNEIENAYVDGDLPFNIQLRAYTMNAVLSASAFLEAAINEVYDDAVDQVESYIGGLSVATKQKLAAYNLMRVPTLKKYRDAIKFTGNSPLDKSKNPYYDAKLLINLRNQLVHSHPVTRAAGDVDELSKNPVTSGDLDKLSKNPMTRQEKVDELCKSLITKFKSSRLMENQKNPYFPDHCLGAGCADWAVKSATAFADDFFGRLRITPHYQQVNYGPA